MLENNYFCVTLHSVSLVSPFRLLFKGDIAVYGTGIYDFYYDGEVSGSGCELMSPAVKKDFENQLMQDYGCGCGKKFDISAVTAQLKSKSLYRMKR